MGLYIKFLFVLITAVSLFFAWSPPDSESLSGTFHQIRFRFQPFSLSFFFTCLLHLKLVSAISNLADYVKSTY
jgi:hypothetical protein